MQYIWLQTERQKGFPGSLLNLENKYWTKSKECQNYDKKTISREFNFSLFEKPSFSREFDFKSSQKSNFSREYNFGNSTQICEFRNVFFQKKLPSVCKPIKLLCTITYATTPKYKPVSLSKDKSYAALLFTRFYFSSFLSTNSL